MEADYFRMLRLRPGRYSPEVIDRQYRYVRWGILRSGGSDRQRRLDDVFIARSLLRDPARQEALARQAWRQVETRPGRKTARPVPVPRPPVAPAEPAEPPPPDAYARFARMVTQHVESGLLRFTARLRLMLLAKGLGIGEFKANLIIAEVLHDVRAGVPQPGRAVTPPLVRPAEEPRAHPYRLYLALALAAAAILDGLVAAWLAG